MPQQRQSESGHGWGCSRGSQRWGNHQLLQQVAVAVGTFRVFQLDYIITLCINVSTLFSVHHIYRKLFGTIPVDQGTFRKCTIFVLNKLYWGIFNLRTPYPPHQTFVGFVDRQWNWAPLWEEFTSMRWPSGNWNESWAANPKQAQESIHPTLKHQGTSKPWFQLRRPRLQGARERNNHQESNQETKIGMRNVKPADVFISIELFLVWLSPFVSYKKSIAAAFFPRACANLANLAAPA